MNRVIIECVWYRSKRDFNKFLKSIEDPNAIIIDYLIIKNKLIKADPYREEPNDSIVALYIINQIKSIFSDQEKPKTIIYTFRNLSTDIISNVKDLIDSSADEPYTFSLNVLKMNKTPSRAILNQFDSIKFIDND